tara:strand:+ start:99 stop:662 length:564 start_codon:yes stop_codon:yes gene_type:complete
MDEQFINKPKFDIKSFFKKNKIKIFLIVAIIVVSTIILIVLEEHKTRKNIDISENYNKAKILIENKNPKEALKILEEIILQKNSFYSPSALNLIIDNNLIKDKKKILSYYDQIILDTTLDLETKNLFIFKKIVFIGDEIEESELLNNLKPIINSNSLLKNIVLDYIKKYYLSKGEIKKAQEFKSKTN